MLHETAEGPARGEKVEWSRTEEAGRVKGKSKKEQRDSDLVVIIANVRKEANQGLNVHLRGETP